MLHHVQLPVLLSLVFLFSHQQPSTLTSIYHRKQIQNWRRAKATIEASVAAGCAKKQRLTGGGRTQRYSVVNVGVRDWIKRKRSDQQCVSRRMIRLEAKHIARESDGCDDFSASLGWLQKFLRRNNFTLRATTTTC